MRTVASTVLVGFLLCLCLHQSLGQGVLPLYHECEGEKYDMCKPGAVCRDGRKCRVYVGDLNCDFYRPCKRGYWCTQNICVPSGYCGEPVGSKCGTIPICDPLLKFCRMRPGTKAYHFCRNETTPFEYSGCMSGASCINERYCRCNKGVSKQNGTMCVPLPGKVGGRCKTGKICDDPNAKCKRKKCECLDGFSVIPANLTCGPEIKLEQVLAGGSCAGPYQTCAPRTVCDSDLVCKILALEDCRGKKRDLCLSGLCIKGICRGAKGQNCKSRAEEPCEEGTTCARSANGYNICGLGFNADCKDDPDLCVGNAAVCDQVTHKCKKALTNGECYTDDDCTAWATCAYEKPRYFTGTCACKLSEKLTGPRGDYCAMPKGVEGAPCNSSKDCTDKRAKCDNASGLCKCRPGYTVNLHTGACELAGPKCLIEGCGFIQPFFPAQIKHHVRLVNYYTVLSRSTGVRVGLPCSFKAANFKCGNADIEIYGNMTYARDSSRKYLVSGVIVNISTTTDDGQVTYQLYTLVTKPNDTQSREWQTTCMDGQCVGQDDVKLISNTRTGHWELRKRLLKVTYSLPYDSSTTNLKNGKPDLPARLLIECGHGNFRSLQRYPDVLCGSPKDSVKDVENFNKELQREQKNEDPVDYAFLPQLAFSRRRISDHAVLRRQHVPHSDPMCQEAADIVTGDCPALVAKMYNCSSVFEENYITNWKYRSVRIYCVGLDVMALYNSCLRVLCGKMEGKKDDICRVLKEAYDSGCGTREYYTHLPTPKRIKISDLYQRAGCSSSQGPLVAHPYFNNYR